jgi:GntR family transcriptional regulator / MocR family aminotransferase
MNTNHIFAIDRIASSFEKHNRKKMKKKYIILYQAIKDCIHKVELPHLWIIPSTRILANELNLSRTTVVKGYELLSLEKLILPKRGSGYSVNFPPKIILDSNQNKNLIDDNSLYPELSEKGIAFLSNLTILNRESNKGIAFRPGLPPLDIFPVNQWKNLLNTYWRYVKSSGLSDSPSSGIEVLKKNICNYLNISRNIKCEPDQLIIVSGSLQSLYLISSVLINKGDAIILENPTFPNVHSIFKSSLANLISISLDDEGISLEEINKSNNLKPKLVHVTPSNHYPLGIKMSLKRKKELITWASKNKALIIENDYENEVSSHQGINPSIYSLDNEDRTIYLGTFNRLLHPTIRLGYMIVPKYLIKTVEALQEHSHKFVAPSIQSVMSQFIEKNYLYQHLKNINTVAQEREALFISLFNENTSKMSIEKKPYSSLHLVAKFNQEIDIKKESEIIKSLSKINIVVHSLSGCYIGNEKQQGLIFGYSSVRPTIIRQKVIQMTDILNECLV